MIPRPICRKVCRLRCGRFIWTRRIRMRTTPLPWPVIFSNAEQAILPAEKAIELSPGFALGHFALGMAQLSSGRAPDAIVPFRARTQTQPARSAEPCLVQFAGNGAALCGRHRKRLADRGAGAGGSTGLAANAGNNGLLLRGHRQVGRRPPLCPGDGATQMAIERQARAAEGKKSRMAGSNERPAATRGLGRTRGRQYLSTRQADSPPAADRFPGSVFW